jgi:hypothetical protein
MFRIPKENRKEHVSAVSETDITDAVRKISLNISNVPDTADSKSMVSETDK